MPYFLSQFYYQVVEVTLDSCYWNQGNDEDEDEDVGSDGDEIPCVAYATQAVDVNTW